MLWNRMKAAGPRRNLPAKSKGPIRAQLRQPEPRPPASSDGPGARRDLRGG